MTHLAVAAVLLAAGPAAPPAVSPDPRSLEVSAADREAARALVRRLGSDRFADRDEASKQLRAMGRRALPALAEAVARDPDAEVRHRCELLLPAAAAEDFDARLAAFLADADGKFAHDLPGWAKFREQTGNDPLARELFAELLKSEPNRDLIAGLAQGKEELERRVIARRYELYLQVFPRRGWAGVGQPEPTLIDAAGLLFAESLVPDKFTPRGALRTATPYAILTRTGVRTELTTHRFGPAVQKLAIAWMDTRETAPSLSQAISLASQLHPKAVGRYAAKLIRTGGATAYQRASAATTVARVGTRDDLPALVPLLTDDAAVRTTAGGADIQVRDVALAMAALLTGRDPAEFGMVSQSSGGPQYYYWNYSFPDEAAREKGLAKWAELEPKFAPKK